MKRALSMALLLGVSAALLLLAPASDHSAFAVHAGSGCTNASLSGNYGFTFSGFTTANKSVNSVLVPFYGEGLLTFDGKGNVSGTFTSAQGGEAGVPNNPYSATYTVNPDCTVSIVGNSGSDSLDAVIVGGGSEVLATDISAPDTLNVEFKKQ